MSQKHFLVCEGCDKECWISSPDAPTPKDFVHCSVNIGSWGIETDLCLNCYNYLLDYADPRKWPRAIPEDRIS